MPEHVTKRKVGVCCIHPNMFNFVSSDIESENVVKIKMKSSCGQSNATQQQQQRNHTKYNPYPSVSIFLYTLRRINNGSKPLSARRIFHHEEGLNFVVAVFCPYQVSLTRTNGLVPKLTGLVCALNVKSLLLLFIKGFVLVVHQPTSPGWFIAITDIVQGG
mmetsp:Transcript_16967/g.35043  ORF Transcript_16967/g.35043 Transcript_16967/m.35043 type:complete len:161 (+) Transcript_16967:139-621(+)